MRKARREPPVMCGVDITLMGSQTLRARGDLHYHRTAPCPVKGLDHRHLNNAECPRKSE